MYSVLGTSLTNMRGVSLATISFDVESIPEREIGTALSRVFQRWSDDLDRGQAVEGLSLVDDGGNGPFGIVETTEANFISCRFGLSARRLLAGFGIEIAETGMAEIADPEQYALLLAILHAKATKAPYYQEITVMRGEAAGSSYTRLILPIFDMAGEVVRVLISMRPVTQGQQAFERML